jgi:predicted DNA-binding transcriptional regulator AlpA
MVNKCLTIKQTAELIGRSEAAIRNLCMRHKIPFRKAGGRLIFLTQEIQDWIEKAEGVTLEQIKNKTTY